MERFLRAHLLACATAFELARNLKRSTVGRLAVNDWRFFDRLESGANFTARKYDELIAWFKGNWPDGSEMPLLAITGEAESPGDPAEPAPAFPLSSSITVAAPLFMPTNVAGAK